jgi:hypothetical protein
MFSFSSFTLPGSNKGIFMGSASGFSFNVLKNSNSLSIGMFGCSSEYSKVKHIGKKKLGKLKKDWFNDDCHFERRNFRKRKRIFQKK